MGKLLMMGNDRSAKYANFARPYALAAFEYGRDNKQLESWKSFLESAAEITRNPSVMRILDNPEHNSEDLYQLFHGILKPIITKEQENFLLLLARNKRLIATPEICKTFNAYYAGLEKITDVRVVTATEASDAFKQKLSQSLATRLKHEVRLACEVDSSIIGGAIIHIGDRVIDGSVRGKLSRLLEFSLR